MRTWRAERTVDEALVRELLRQFPELEVDAVRRLAEGWDRSVWLVDETLVFGFPRRAVVVPGIERELALLPRLAPLLPLPVPVPAFVGLPARDFPWPFFGSVFLPGRESGEAGLDEDGRTAVGVEIAGFLRRLHGREIAEAVGAATLPLDPNRRADMRERVPKARESLRELERLGLWRQTRATLDVLRDGARLPPSRQTESLVHGDLHFRHLLVDSGRASGVVDWIDVCRGDPALDLQIVWSFLAGPGRAAFLAAYGTVDDEQLLRARVLALSLAADLALYAHAEGHPAIEREALASLTRALAD
jgi:aminoglycoside phosphotransferase (APT) family kinase protein